MLDGMHLRRALESVFARDMLWCLCGGSVQYALPCVSVQHEPCRWRIYFTACRLITREKSVRWLAAESSPGCCTPQVTVSGLIPGTVIYYKVGDPTQAAAGGVSDVFSFKVCGASMLQRNPHVPILA